MNKRFLVELGSGTDQHVHNNDCTDAAIKAVKNAIANNCLTGLSEVYGFREPKDLSRMYVHVKIGAPYPDKIDKEKVLHTIPFGVKSIEVVKGGLVAKGIMIKKLGDTSDQIIVCNAAVTVSISPH